MGYADLHCHLLWGIDDGAKTPEDTLGMARALVQLGFSHVAPSPHARPEYPNAEACAARRQEVQDLLNREKVPLTLHQGAEHVFDDGLVLLSSFHPSRQNTQTGRLTRAMWHRVFERARRLVEGAPRR